MGAGDVDPIANEQRRLRLHASVERACEGLVNAALSHPANGALRERYKSDPSALFASAWQCVATAAIFAWTDARWPSVVGGSGGDGGAWSAFLQRVRRAHEGPSRSALGVCEGVIVTRALADELATWSVSDESMRAVSDSIEMEFKQPTARDWRAMDSVELVATLADVRAMKPVFRSDLGVIRLVGDAAASAPLSASVAQFAARTALDWIDRARAERPADELVIVDPCCGSGVMLVAATRELVRREPFDERVDVASIVASVIADRVRGMDRAPTNVALARLSLWLEAPTILRGSALQRCVPDVESTMTSRGRAMVLTDARLDAGAALEHGKERLEIGDALCALVAPRLAWSSDHVVLRGAVLDAFDVAQPVIELSSARESALVLVAQRTRARTVESARRWTTTIVGASDEERQLLEHLQRFTCFDDQLDRGVQLDKPEIEAPNACCLWRAKGRLVAAGTACSTDPEALKLWGTSGTWMSAALLAWFSASAVRWQFATLTRLRRRAGAALSIDDVCELVSPELARHHSWEPLWKLGLQLESRGTDPSVISQIDDLVHDVLSLDGAQRRAIVAWRRTVDASGSRSVAASRAMSAERPQPEQSAPSAGRDEVLSRTLGSSQRGPAPPSVGRNDDAQGRGAEGALRARATDGRSAVVSSKRRVDQPEDEAEREAFALAVAAGSEGIPLGELVRRAREHTEDELRAALDALARRGWVRLSDDAPPRVFAARAAIAKRAR